MGVAAVAAAVVFTKNAVSGPDPASDPAATAQVTSTVEHWGSYFGSHQGNYGTEDHPVAVQIPGHVVQVATSNSTEYALNTAGQVYAWGLGTLGELGDGRRVNSLKAPIRVRFPAGVKIAWLPTDVMPYDSGLAVDTTGHAWGWGDNAGGEFCLGNRKLQVTPVRLSLPDITALAGASDHAIYDSRGTVYACGQNVQGDLGTGWKTGTMRPRKVAGLDGSLVTELVASFANSGALLANGDYFDWGYDGQGQLGDGHKGTSSDRPVQVELSAPVVRVALGGSIWGNGQTVVKLANGTLWGWGSNRGGQLGNGTTKSEDHPMRFFTPSRTGYKLLATGSATSYAVTDAGDVYSWGMSHLGQVGDGHRISRGKPVLVDRGALLISATANNVVVAVTGLACHQGRCTARADPVALDWPGSTGG